MKKLIALFVVCGLLVGIAGVFAADAAVAKAPAKKTVKKAPVKKPVKKVAPKKAAPAPAPVAPAPPPPPPVAPVAPPAPVAPAPAPTSSLFGWNIKTDVSAGYLMAGSNSLMGLKGNFILDDPLALGSMLGLGAKAVNYRVGLAYMTGKDNNGNSMTAIPLVIDGILNLPADMMGGIQSYIGGGVNYVVYGNEKKAGTYGIQVLAGVQGNIGLGGNSYAELSYSIIRSGDVAKRSAKGISITVGQQILL